MPAKANCTACSHTTSDQGHAVVSKLSCVSLAFHMMFLFSIEHDSGFLDTQLCAVSLHQLTLSVFGTHLGSQQAIKES